MDVPGADHAAPQPSASDLFGLGLLLYRCLHGRLPDEMADSYLGLAYSRTRTPISVPPSPLQGLLQRCLALDPAQRPRSAAEVLTALDQIAPIPPHQDSVEVAPLTGLGSSRTTQVGLAITVTLLVTVLGLVTAIAPAGAPGPAVPGTTPPAGPLRPGGGPAAPGPAAPAPTPAAPAPALLNPVNGLVRIGIGLSIVGVALTVAQQIRRRWTSRAPEARRAATILFGAGQRDALTRSLMIEVDLEPY